MNQAILESARASGTPVIDLADFFAARSRGGITGYDWLLDHVHPSIRAHQLIAGLVTDEMVRLGEVRPRRAGSPSVPGSTAKTSIRSTTSIT